MGKGADAMSRQDQVRTGATDEHPIMTDPPGSMGGNDGDEQQVSEIREGIEQTRADLSETIDALQERLSPSRLKEQVREQVAEQYEQAKQTVREATIGKVENMVERVSDKMYQTRGTIVETVKANPVPSALV